MIKRTALCIVATLVLLLPAAPPVHAASCRGASHAITLSAGAASPRSGTTATGITFSVHFASNAGCAPSSVTVDVAGVGTFPLASSGTDYAGGETFIRTMTLPVGLHSYTFTATAGSGRGEQSIILTSVNPDAVAITAPTPPPTPSPPPPTPAPTPPAPTAPPAAAPAPAAPAAPGGPAPTPAPVTSGVTPTTVPTPGPDDAPAGSATPSIPPSSDPAPAAPSPSVEPAGEHDSWIGAPIVDGGSPRTPDKAALIGDGGGSGMSLVVSIAATLGMLLAAVLLSRRRSHAEPAAAAGVSVPAASALPTIPAMPVSIPLPDDEPIAAVRPLPPMRELVPPVNPSLLEEDDAGQPATGPGHPDEEGLPRWLRPSVREARFANDRDRRRSWG